MNMKNILPILLLLLNVSCTKQAIKLNDSLVRFDHFPFSDTLNFIPVSDALPGAPAQMIFYKDQLIIQTFGRATPFVVLYSLAEDSVTNEWIKYGDGPDEMLSCEINLCNEKLWMYDMTKMRVGSVPVDSLTSDSLHIDQHKLTANYYYRTALLNDSIMLGTNDLGSRNKIAYVNLKSGEVTGKGDYAHLDAHTDLDVLIDACSCCVAVNQQSKDIALAYRYTDVIEIYDANGRLKHALQGPDNFDIAFDVSPNGMAKTPETRKACVNMYATDHSIYLLHSGCKRTEENWAYGTSIIVYSWDGEVKGQYLLPEPVYAFAVDEKDRFIYAYSVQTEKLIKASF